MKKILFLNVAPLPHSIDLHSGLIKAGYEVSFWYITKKRDYYPWKKLNYNNPFNVFDGKIKTFWHLLTQSLKKDLIIITGWHTWAHVLLALVCFTTRKRYVYWLDVPEKQKRGIKKTFKGLLLNLANGLFITGHSGFDFFKQEYGINKNKCYDFPYLENKPSLSDVLKNNQIRKDSLENNAKINILTSNRFLPRKGYSTLIAALKNLPEEVQKKIKVSIIGSGNLFEDYNRQFQEINAEISLYGWKEYSEYLEIMNQTDIYIHASIHEPFGIPPMDAMARGKLVIGSSGVFSCTSRIKSGENGYVFKAGDPGELKSLLEKIISNSAIIYEIGDKAYETSTMFGIEHNIGVIERFLKNSKK